MMAIVSCMNLLQHLPAFFWRHAPLIDSRGASCRRSGNQGTTSRPATALDTLQKISPRARLSKPGEPREGFPLARDLSLRGHRGCRFRSRQGPGSPSLASLARVFPSRGILQAWRASRGIFPREASSPRRTFRTPSAILLRIKPKARRGFSASRGFSFPTKETLSPR